MGLLSLLFRTNFLLYYEKFFIISDGLRWLSSDIFLVIVMRFMYHFELLE